MKFENVLAEVDGFGRFQLMIILMTVIPRMTLPFHFLLNNLSQLFPLTTATSALWMMEDILGIYPRKRGLLLEDGTPNSCQMFAEPQYHLLLNSSSMTELPTVPCQNGWVYDTFRSSLATEWDLVCDKRKMNRATATIFFLGVMFGAAAFGYISDRFGRKNSLLVSYVTTSLFGFTSALSYNFTMFAVMRFLTGFGIAGISIEWVDIKHRTKVGVLMSLDWSIFTALLPVVAYFVNDWRVLTATATSPLILAMISWWWLPESARWLISNGNVKAAHFYLRKCAKVNGREQFMADLKPESLSKVILVENENRKYSYLDLVRTPRMRRLAILTAILIYGLIELPAKSLIYFTMKKVGRRSSQGGALVLTGLCIFCNMFVPQDMGLFRIAVGALGKMFAEASFTCVYLYTTELYPTAKWIGVQLLHGPYRRVCFSLIILLEEVWGHLPSTIFSLVAVTVGLTCYFLPETQNIRLPETIEEMKFENVLAEVDGFGKFQLLTIFLMVIPRVTLPFHFLMNNFIAVIPSHHCNISSLDDGAVFKNLSQEERLVVGGWDSKLLSMFAEPQYHLLLNSSSMTELPTVPCQNGWVYDNNIFKSTLATEWDLVCDKRRMNRATASIFFSGVMFGAAAFGYLSDSLDWSIFTALLPVVAYFVNDWRVLTATATSPLILAMITWCGSLSLPEG
ncbi:hypothetical protein F7725_005697 [Dissostichus mawsoni]|uniref:Uncharacterized protein n=1 Tax=Dissostichus mawsoni TaxID=36200 RepID=A0A7J5YS04_DISMA|nr:hypothetical protein F7725_005697 [Dissostichus mawsoni]